MYVWVHAWRDLCEEVEPRIRGKCPYLLGVDVDQIDGSPSKGSELSLEVGLNRTMSKYCVYVVYIKTSVMSHLGLPPSCCVRFPTSPPDYVWIRNGEYSHSDELSLGGEFSFCGTRFQARGRPRVPFRS